MKTMLLAAAAALSLGVGSAYAAESGGQPGGYVYPDYQFPTQSAPSAATAQSGQGVHTYATHSQNLGTWLFPANQNSGANS